jgi:hypothetical protein
MCDIEKNVVKNSVGNVPCDWFCAFASRALSVNPDVVHIRVINDKIKTV